MRWSITSLFRTTKPTRRRPITRARLALEQLETRLAPAVDILTFHNDIASTGVNANETSLTPANVLVNSFGKLYTVAVDGQVYAQPLEKTNVTIANGVNAPSGTNPAGTYSSVVFVATENNSLYAIDGSVAGGKILWKRTFLDISNPGGNNPGGDINNTLNATAIACPTNGDVGSGDIQPTIGITGTPVIDPATNILYVVPKTKETINGGIYFVQRLHAINIADGTDEVVPYFIGSTTQVNTNSTQIYVYGAGDGNVTDPYNGTGNKVVQFNAFKENERQAINLVNNQIYIAWASHGDQGPYHGWVVDWDVSNVLSQGFVLKGALNATPNGGLGGIWGGGGRLSFENDGSAFYFETGNGRSSHPNPTLDANGFPVDGDYFEGLVKVVADPNSTPTSQNINGWGLKVADYFIPYNQIALDNADRDFGSGSPLILPDSAGVAGHPHLLLASGKEGKIYVIDRDTGNLGKFDPNADHVVNAIPNGDGNGHNTPPVQLGGSLSTAAFFNGKIYWTSGYSGTARVYGINSNGTLSITSQTVATFGYLPGSESISANGTTGGIAWIMDRNANQIHAYDTNTFATELWNSGQKAGGADNLGAVVKFAAPIVANGEVYVGTTNSLVVYGLTPPATQPPNAPALTATALSGTSINLTWTDSTQPPNLASGYLIEQSTDNVNFTQITTAPANATSLAIGGLTPLTTYYYRIRGFNGLGNGPYSNTSSATTTNNAPALDFSNGFAGSNTMLTYNGSSAINGTKLELTNGGANEAGSTFSTNPVDITKFTTQFTFQLTNPNGDGFTFAIQGNSPTALGPSGGGLGYGPDHSSGSGGIPKSAAIKFDLYNNEGEGNDSTGLYLGGAAPTVAGSIDLTATGVNLHSGDVFQVNMTYDGTTLTVTIKDTQTNATATQNYTVNIPAAVGGSTAYAGFTGGTGGATATQDVLTWILSPNSPQAPNAPSALGASPATATSINLTWTNNATNQTGFHLDRATDSGFTQNLVTQNLPATPNSFTDSYTGLAPGSTFYYRLRAFNTAGDSANSNVAQVAIPLAPPKPTNAQVLGVLPTEIDLSWTDNAGILADTYVILRSVDGGSFIDYIHLPPLHTTPPSTYTWSDTGLTPGTSYEYHIEAVNTSGNNDFVGANAVTITSPPTNLTATSGSATVSLSWTAPPKGALTYDLYRGTTPGGEGTTPLAAGLTTTAFTDSTAAAGATYYYTVTALNANVNHQPVLPAESAASNEASATTSILPGTPATLTATGGVRQIALTWAASANATSYNLYRGTSASGEGSTPYKTGLTGTTYTDANLGNGVAYYYFVTGVNSSGESGHSPEATASTTSLPGAPANLTASGGAGTIVLSWGAATGAASYNVYRGTAAGGESTTALATGLTTTAFTDANLPAGTTYYYVVTATNAAGEGVKSNEAVAATNPAAALDFSNGFAGSNSLLKFNGFTAINGTRLRLTNGSANQASSAFSNNTVYVNKFTTQFTFQQASAQADGFTFTIQGVGPSALGTLGGGLGYGPDHVGGTTASIGKSVAIKFDLYNNQGEGIDSTGLYTNGAAPTNIGSIDLTPTGINLRAGDLSQVNMTYDGTTLTVTIKDTVTNKTATQSYAIDIVGTVGGSTAYVGFTAGTGGATSIQDIVTWTFTPTASQAPAAPSALAGSPATANSISLSWTNNATNQTGFHLDRATDSGFTQNLVTQTLPPSPNSFTDAAAGLSPGSTYYYRLRAFNAAGDSSNSNVPTIAIPLAPPAPTNGQFVAVATTSLGLTWTDNAGSQATGYVILRSVDGGAFANYTQLAASANAPPSTYSWTDTGLTPGTAYAYNIEAVNTSGNNGLLAVNAVTITSPPSGLSATAGTNGVTLSWTAPPKGALTYKVYRGTSAGGEGTTPLATGLSATSYTDGAVAAGTAYYYTVTAVNANVNHQPVLPAESAASNEASATTKPAAPASLSATGGVKQIALTWSAVAGATSYKLYRGTSAGGEGTTAYQSGLTGTSYTDASLGNGATFYYFVTAVDAGGEGAQSPEANATTTALPVAPPNLAATGAAGSITLNWGAATGASTYSVYRGTSAGGEGTTPLTAGLTSTTFTDSNLPAGSTYYYVVTATNAAGEGPKSNEASATTTSMPGVPAAPAGLTAVSSTSVVALSWSASAGATSYKIYRGTSAGGEGATPLASGVAGTSFADTQVAQGNPTYYYVVTAVNANGESGKSNESTATLPYVAHINFSASTTEVPFGYFNDLGNAYGLRGNGLTFGWNVDNTANARDRNFSNSPDEVHDSLNHMQKPNNPNASWSIALPNGTYVVHVLVGDPANYDSVYKVNVQNVLAVSGTPNTNVRWFDGTVTVNVTNGLLVVSSATGSSNNKIDGIDITQPAGSNVISYPSGFSSATGLTLNGTSAVSGSALQLTNGGTSQAGSAFATTAVGVNKFTTQFLFQQVSPYGDGLTFTLQGVAPSALGLSGSGLGSQGIANSVSIKFDLYNNNGEGPNSTGLFLNGAAPTNPGSIDLTPSGVNLHSSHAMFVSMSYDGSTLQVTITDTVTGAKASQSYSVNIAGTVGGTMGFVGFTGGTGSNTSTQNILNWTYTPLP